MHIASRKWRGGRQHNGCPERSDDDDDGDESEGRAQRERDKEGTTAAKMREDLLLLKMDRCAKAAGDNQPASLPFFSNFFLLFPDRKCFPSFHQTNRQRMEEVKRFPSRLFRGSMDLLFSPPTELMVENNPGNEIVKENEESRVGWCRDCNKGRRPDLQYY